MKRAVLAVSLLLLLATGFVASQNKTAPDDSAAVASTVRNYIEAYYTADAARMGATLHSHYMKHIIHGDIAIREKTGPEMIEAARANRAADLAPADKTEQISVLDVSGDMASAKLVTPHWIDYMTLTKSEGKWKILAVVQQIED
jgi:Putative lumazine-binding